MKIILLFIISVFVFTTSLHAQNVGIGTDTPSQKLDINGTVRATQLMLDSGVQTDELRKGGGDSVVFLKGKGGLGLNYIIALYGIYPSQTSGGDYTEQIVGEIRLFAGNFAPDGFAFCQGQLLQISSNTALFALLGTTYGGDGVTTFALPDLRGAVPVGFGVSGSGPSWIQGQRSN